MALTVTDFTLPKEQSSLTEADVTAFVTRANEKGWDKATAQTYLDERLDATTGYLSRTAAARQAELEKVKPEALKRPDGSPLPEASVAEVVAYAKAHGLTLEAAQQQIELLDGTVRGDRQRTLLEHQTRIKNWKAEVEADKELGGANLPRTQKRIALVRETLDKDGAVTALLDETGGGNHIAIVRLFDRIGVLLEEDRTVIGGGASGGGQPKKSAVEHLYGKPAA